MKTIQNLVLIGKYRTVPFNSLPIGLLVLCLLTGLFLTACGGSGSGSNLLANAQASGAEGSVDQSQNPLPGTEEFGLSKKGLVNNIEEVESLIAACMNDAGFEYVAVDYNTVRRGMVADKSLPGISEKGFFERYGFGISTLYTGLPPQLSEALTPAQIGLGSQNIQIFRNLSPADQIAYNRTLFGENSDATFAVGIETEDFSRTGGCTRAAIEQVFTPEQLTVSYHNPKDALIEADVRMVSAVARFGECMRDAGFDYNHEAEIEPDLRDRLWEITEGAPVQTLSSEAKAALAELQNYELALGIVAFECEQKYLDPVEDQVERELYARRDQQ